MPETERNFHLLKGKDKDPACKFPLVPPTKVKKLVTFPDSIFFLPDVGKIMSIN
jgi:hypothetical protein